MAKRDSFAKEFLYWLWDEFLKPKPAIPPESLSGIASKARNNPLDFVLLILSAIGVGLLIGLVGVLVAVLLHK